MGVMGRRRERFEGADEGGDTSECGGRTSALSLGISLRGVRMAVPSSGVPPRNHKADGYIAVS